MPKINRVDDIREAAFTLIGEKEAAKWDAAGLDTQDVEFFMVAEMLSEYGNASVAVRGFLEEMRQDGAAFGKPEIAALKVFAKKVFAIQMALAD